jgi:SsrA-binding protein
MLQRKNENRCRQRQPRGGNCIRQPTKAFGRSRLNHLSIVAPLCRQQRMNYNKEMKKKQAQTKQIVNRRARHDYELSDSLLVGIALTGAETKALRMGHGQLRGAYVTVKEGELLLINAAINGTKGIPIEESDQTRARKLLAKHREIHALIEAKQQGRTIVPLEMLTGGRFIKLRIAIGRGRRQYDKREALKARDAARRVRSIRE